MALAVTRVLVLAGLWAVMVEGRPGAWVPGVVAVALAVAVRSQLGGPRRLRVRPAGALRFAPYFLWQSIRGGTDVAVRALRPSLPIRPDLLDYRITLPDGPARIFFVNAMSLLPGTYSARLDGDAVTVHALDLDPGFRHRLGVLERRVAAMFGEAGPAGGGGARAGGAEP